MLFTRLLPLFSLCFLGISCRVPADRAPTSRDGSGPETARQLEQRLAALREKKNETAQTDRDISAWFAAHTGSYAELTSRWMVYLHAQMASDHRRDFLREYYVQRPAALRRLADTLDQLGLAGLAEGQRPAAPEVLWERVVAALRAGAAQLRGRFQQYAAEHSVPEWVSQRARMEGEVQLLEWLVGEKSAADLARR